MNKIDISKLTYRPCVGIMLINDEGLIFTGRRIPSGREALDDGYSWQMPQGGIDKGEDPISAAKRELYEETNIKSVEYISSSKGWLTYDLPLETVIGHWGGRFKGQTQKWVLFRFTGEESEINVTSPANGHHKAEFDNWAWKDPKSLPDLIIPFKRQVYIDIIEEFLPYF